jgi:hypothetical protein
VRAGSRFCLGNDGPPACQHGVVLDDQVREPEIYLKLAKWQQIKPEDISIDRLPFFATRLPDLIIKDLGVSLRQHQQRHARFAT